MLKKFISKVKSFVGVKSKLKSIPKVIVVPGSKPIVKLHITEKPRKIVPGALPRHEPRKKETPEEYKLRQAKRTQTKDTHHTKHKKETILDTWDPSNFKVPEVEGNTRFHDFDLAPEIMHAIFDSEFQYCTPVQAETLPKSLAGMDVTAQAQTGTGKTAAFLITFFNHFLKNPILDKRKPGTPRVLVLAPTRELVLQIEKDARSLGNYVPCFILSLLGGIDYKKQLTTLQNKTVDILICTPGRLIDFMEQRLVDLGSLEILVIDEADRMLDMGFIPSVKRIVSKTPKKEDRQTMFFSATMSGDVRRLADSWTRQAFDITIRPDEVAVNTVNQITYLTTVAEKLTVIHNIITQRNLERVLIFVNRKDHARKLKDKLEQYGISCTLLSGDVDQPKRINRLERFREGKVRVLVATDVASRGIHVEAISHVINFNMPIDVEEYVHRIGRTGRAGAAGTSISFADEDNSHELLKLEKFLGQKIDCVYPEEELLTPLPPVLHKAKVRTAFRRLPKKY